MAATNLIRRTRAYAVAVGKLIMSLPDNRINRISGNQIIRSSSSVYTNFRASQRAKPDADFINKLKIVEEECDETIGFFELILEFNLQFESKINELLKEGNELLSITIAPINTVRKRINKK